MHWRETRCYFLKNISSALEGQERRIPSARKLLHQRTCEGENFEVEYVLEQLNTKCKSLVAEGKQKTKDDDANFVAMFQKLSKDNDKMKKQMLNL